MTVSIALTGKSGSGKTTIIKSISESLKDMYPEKSILLIDNDLSKELSLYFGIETQNTLYDLLTNNYTYKSKLPEGMSKQEYIEWVLQDLVTSVSENTDLLATGYLSTTDCKCFAKGQVKEALNKFIKNYDIVLFDCEFDLEYLSHLVGCHIDVTLIIAEPTISSVYAAAKIRDLSQKHAAGEQIGIMLNKLKQNRIPESISGLLNEYDLELLGTLPFVEEVANNIFYTKSKELENLVEGILYRLNLPFDR